MQMPQGREGMRHSTNVKLKTSLKTVLLKPRCVHLTSYFNTLIYSNCSSSHKSSGGFFIPNENYMPNFQANFLEKDIPDETEDSSAQTKQ